jgi:hypothetical protein
VIGLLIRRLEEEFARRGGLRNEGLTVVQGLRGDFPGMVYPHERGGEAALGVGKGNRLRGGRACGAWKRRGRAGSCRGDGHWPGGARGGEQGAEGPVGRRQKAI